MQSEAVARGQLGVRKGSWTAEEDLLLRQCIEKYGEGNWHQIPQLSGLNRCRKSCRLRWLNYVRPNIKRGKFTMDEVDLLIRLHKLLGNRWSIIAGRLPGRTTNDVKNYWNTHINKKFLSPQKLTRDATAQRAVTVTTPVIKPKPWIFKGSSSLPMIKVHEMVEKPKEYDKGFRQENVFPEKLENKFFHNSGIETAHTQKQVSGEKDARPMMLNEVQSLRAEDGQNGWDDFFLDLNYWDVMSPNYGRIEDDLFQGYEASQSPNFNYLFIN